MEPELNLEACINFIGLYHMRPDCPLMPLDPCLGIYIGALHTASPSSSSPLCPTSSRTQFRPVIGQL